MKMEHTLALIERAHQGDKEARDLIFQENIGLVWSIVKRFQNRGVDLEDLFQIGSIGLLKAVDKFDTSYEVKFSTYAVPMISGEIKRFLRDDGMIKVSRSLKETCYKAYLAREKLEKKMGRDPQIQEMAKEIGIPEEELIQALDSSAEIESLQKTIYRGEGNDICLLDKLEEKRDRQEESLNRILLEEILGSLSPQERQLIYMRYFQERTQTEIAGELGISQVQVSRMEKKILKRLREQI
ncbi:MAG TPA: RNA polymerase sporulation sigma factor SigF [Candidatus Blautia intestinigallinarum]|nr:RNA polymerase sporulation sigma factor SigF [Candidatus Blautia intestinigallinarum]